jgi:alpha-D-xyloside xylohydrolase
VKFTDGNWLMRPGVRAHYAAEVHEMLDVGADGITLLVPCHNIRHRGDTLTGPVLTIRLFSPAEGVIGVRIEHFRGVRDRGPHFEIYSEAGNGSADVQADQILFCSGGLTARVDRKTWRIEFQGDGRPLTTSPLRSAAMMETPDGKFIADSLTLGVGENVYGLGERFTPFVKNGQSVDIWNADGGTNSEQAYKNIPFYLTNRGYGVLVNSPDRVSFEVATEKTNRVGFSVPGDALEYFVIYGPTPKEILNRYTALTGRPALPPKWSLDLWLSTSFTTNYDEATVNSFIDGMAEREIPLGVFHYDCFWMKGFHWTDFEWDSEVFPDPKGMIERLHDRGLRVCVWINSYIAQAASTFDEAARAGYLLRRPNGDIWQWDLWQPGMGIVDFTNPAARQWFQEKIGALIDLGVDAIKTDFGERIPTDVAWFDGSDPARMHNYYSVLYNQAVFEAIEERRGTGQAVLFARSATVGGQKYPVHWGGDCWSTYEAMAESLRGGLSLCLSGFGFWSHDIGGFEGSPPPGLYKRWVAFGLLSSHSRLHGSTSYRVPWLVDDEASEVLRHFARLKKRLMPYLWAKTVEAHETGVPVMRAMMLEFPDDPACDGLDRQYMLGESLLVAPVFTDSGVVDFYLPEGEWTSLWDGRTVEGGRWLRETHDVFSLPLYVRPGTLLATEGDGAVVLTAYDDLGAPTTQF